MSMTKYSITGLRRREVLKWAAAAPFVAAIGKTSLAHAAGSSGIRGNEGTKITLKFGSSQPTHTENAHTVFFDTFLSELTKQTNGNVGAIFYGDSQLGPENKYSNQINAGTMDMMMTVSDWTPIVPEIGVLTMGFLFDSLDQTGKVMDGRAGQLLQDIFKKKTKAEILGWCYNFGGRNVLTRKQITTPAEFHGLKLRVLPSPTYVETFRLLGADPVPMSFKEIYTSLETGVIEGLEHDPPTILQFKFFEMAKNYTMTRHIFDPSSPIVSDVTMSKLSEAEQKSLREAATIGVKNQRTKAAEAAKQALNSLKQNGLKTIEIDRAKLTDEVKPLWKNFTDQNPDTKPVLQAILSETGKTL
jgi:tripartite ATP-independent transporter DctP family solute receptor